MPKPKPKPSERKQEKRKMHCPVVPISTAKVKLEKLAEMFPNVIPATIENCLNHYNQRMDPTVKLLTERYGPPKQILSRDWSATKPKAPPDPAKITSHIKKLRQDSLREQFPHAPTELIADLLAQNNYQLTDTEQQLSQIFGPSRGLGVKRVGSKVQKSKKIQKRVREFTDGDFEWKQTGVGLNNLYRSTRDQAASHARSRNDYFQKAVDAYRSGNKLGAKQLSKKGHEEDAKMRSLHNKASIDIFTQRNKGLRDDSINPKIDLHGLHPDEALQILEEKLNIYYENSYYVDLIIGTGHHSESNWFRTNKERLRPAILKWLDQQTEWCSYQEFSGKGTKSKHGGYFRITFIF